MFEHLFEQILREKPDGGNLTTPILRPSPTGEGRRMGVGWPEWWNSALGARPFCIC